MARPQLSVGAQYTHTRSAGRRQIHQFVGTDAQTAARGNCIKAGWIAQKTALFGLRILGCEQQRISCLRASPGSPPEADEQDLLAKNQTACLVERSCRFAARASLCAGFCAALTGYLGATPVKKYSRHASDAASALVSATARRTPNTIKKSSLGDSQRIAE